MRKVITSKTFPYILILHTEYPSKLDSHNIKRQEVNKLYLAAVHLIRYKFLKVFRKKFLKWILNWI